jgi:hypothetical protein
MKKLIAIVTLALSLPAFAGENLNPQKELECLLGSWSVSGTAKLPGSEAVHNVKGTYECKKSGAQIACALMLGGLPDGMKLEANETWAYNAGDDSVHVFSVDNMGSAGDTMGKLDATGFTGKHTSTYQSTPYSKVLKVAFANKTTFKLTANCSFGSKVELTAIHA